MAYTAQPPYTRNDSNAMRIQTATDRKQEDNVADVVSNPEISSNETQAPTRRGPGKKQFTSRMYCA